MLSCQFYYNYETYSFVKEKIIDLNVQAYEGIMIGTFQIIEATTEILSVCNEKTRKEVGDSWSSITDVQCTRKRGV